MNWPLILIARESSINFFPRGHRFSEDNHHFWRTKPCQHQGIRIKPTAAPSPRSRATRRRPTLRHAQSARRTCSRNCYRLARTSPTRPQPTGSPSPWGEDRCVIDRALLPLDGSSEPQPAGETSLCSSTEAPRLAATIPVFS